MDDEVAGRGVVRFVPYSDADLALTVALESSPAVKRNLGGPLDRAGALRVHRHRLDRIAQGDLFYTIAVDGRPDPVGIAAIFQTPWEGGTVAEAGVMLLPGRRAAGVAVEAMRMLVEVARRERVPELHGFSALANRAANTLARRLGFDLVGECDLDYEGRPLRCHHWVLPLDAG